MKGVPPAVYVTSLNTIYADDYMYWTTKNGEPHYENKTWFSLADGSPPKSMVDYIKGQKHMARVLERKYFKDIKLEIRRISLTDYQPTETWEWNENS